MKKNIFISAIVCLSMMMFTACNFLNQEPFDEFTDEDFWKSEDQARSFMYGFYPSVFNGYGTGVSHGPFLMGQTLNDDFTSDVSQNNLQPEIVPETDGSWSFSNIRKANYVLENVDRLPANKATINHYRGVARFFRAYYYANLVFTYGDVPWFDRVPKVSNDKAETDYLYKDRDPRLFVDSCIMADLRYAMDSVRANDGDLHVNRYVVAGMASRLMLREGTFLKYHDIDLDMAEQCLAFAKEAAEMVMKSGSYKLSANYNALFTSNTLAGNNEILMYRHYEDGILAHSTLAYSYTAPQGGASLSLANAFVSANGLPMLVEDENWQPKTAPEFFANRDPRLALCIRYNKETDKYILNGLENGVFGYTWSGFSWNKFMDDSKAGELGGTYGESKNVTDAPCLRYAEVLLNYCEAAYELNQLNAKYTFSQDDLDKSINLIRARAGIPALGMAGDQPTVNGVAFDDPKRAEIEANANGAMTSPLLWEIRRERRVELCFEGFRLNDLKRWKKLDYLWNGCNPEIRYGAYIVLADYTNRNSNVRLEDESATEGYILRNTERQRERPVDRNYISPVPQNQITLYESKGYHLSQTKIWE